MNFLTKGMTISRSKLLAATLLFSSSFAWFFVFFNYFDEIVSPGSVGSSWHNPAIIGLLGSIVISAFIGSVAAGKINRRKLLFSWLVIGIVALIPIVFLRGARAEDWLENLKKMANDIKYATMHSNTYGLC